MPYDWNFVRRKPLKEREISTELQIQLYMHCGECLYEKPKGISAREFAQLELGWTEIGLQVWCKRHEINVMHVDFQGQKHPANLSIKNKET